MNKIVVNKKQLVGMILVIVFSIPLIVLRYFALLNNTEKVSGFFIKIDGSVVAFYAILAVALVAIVCFSLFRKKQVNPFSKSRSRAIAFTGMVFALALLGDFVVQFLKMFNMVTMAEGSLFSRLSSTGALTIMLQGLMAILAAFYILIHAFSYFGGTLNYRNFKVIGMFPSLWMATRLIGVFLVKIRYLNVPQLVLEIVMLLAGMIFFFNLAKMNACFESGVSSVRIFGAGWCTVLLCAVISVPRLLIMISGHKDVLPMVATHEIVDLVMGGFIFIYMLKGNVSPVLKKNQ